MALLGLSPGAAWADSVITIPQPEIQPALLEPDGSIVNRQSDGRNLTNREFSFDDCVRDRRIRYQLQIVHTQPQIPIEAWVGQGVDCNDRINRAGSVRQCWKAMPGPIANSMQAEAVIRLQDIAVRNKNPNADAYVAGTAESCVGLNSFSFNINFMFVQGDVTTGTGANTDVTLDTVGPEPPVGVGIGVGDQLAMVNWTLPLQATDIVRYAVFCDDGTLAPTPVEDSPTDAGAEGVDASTDGGDDAGVPDAEAEVPEEEPDAADTSTPGGPGCPARVALRAGELPRPTMRPCGISTGGTTSRVVVTEFAPNVNLVNDRPYAFAVAAQDRLGNNGPFSEVVCATPVPTVDFFDAYNRAGGAAVGCTTSGSSDLGRAASWCAGAFVAFALAVRVRRRRR